MTPHFFKTPQGTTLPMSNLKGKPYLLVAHRIVWFREEHPEYTIETELSHNEKFALAKATVRDASGKILATAHKREDAAHFGDYIEKSETGAIGRALALCGYGTQFAPEFDEQDRIVDAPVERVKTPAPAQKRGDEPAKKETYENW